MALVSAAGELLNRSCRAKLDTEQAALQLMEKQVRQYFQRNQVDDVAELLGYGTIEADYHVATRMCLEATMKAKMTGTSFCKTGGSEQHLFDVLERWVVYLGVLGSQEQVHCLLHDACCKGQTLKECVKQALNEGAYNAALHRHATPAPLARSAIPSPTFGVASNLPVSISPDIPKAHNVPAFNSQPNPLLAPTTPRQPTSTPCTSTHQFFRGPRRGLKHITSTGTARYVSQSRPATAARLRALAKDI